ncbi:MAG: MmcQ/YjbR family DNA-binding protein [Saprospiraceae bacterium]|nr:MmcQ/YjbR family DNA-binding protein [Saprospiraceae bacterium]
MDIETLRNYCLSKKGCEESFPFDEETLVFKVMGKIFAILPLEYEVPRVNLKADPEQSIIWRELHAQIYPGWHMNKKHWNTVELETGLEDKFILELVDHSYDKVVEKLTRKLKEELKSL